MSRKLLFLISLVSLAFATPSFGWQGKVIGLKDCRAVIVFDGTNLPVTVFLRGVDRAKACPEEARQFLSGAVFGKMVEVKNEQKTGDGVIAEVMMKDGKILNEELLKQDFMRHAAIASPKKHRTISHEVRPKALRPSVGSSEKAPPSTAGQRGGPSAADGVRKWRDKDGNIHFSGTAGGE